MAFSPPTTWNNGLATSGSSSWLADCDRWVSRKLQWSDCDLGRAWLRFFFGSLRSGSSMRINNERG